MPACTDSWFRFWMMFPGCPLGSVRRWNLRSVSGMASRRSGSSSVWRRCRCWGRPPRSGRCSAWLTMRTASMTSRWPSWGLSRDVCTPSASPCCSRHSGQVDSTPLEGIPTQLIQGLGDDEAHGLLRRVVDGPIDVAVAQRVVAESMGSPMALVEIGKGLTERQLSCDELWSGPLPIGVRLEAHFLRQVEALPADTQAVLLIAAAESSGDRSLIESAATAQGLPRTATEPAEAAAVIVHGERLRFRHPLVRSAVYSSASIVDRRRAHLILAEASGAIGDLDRRASATWRGNRRCR